jgi:hypothetical protein
MTLFTGVAAGFERDLGIVRFAAFRNIAPDRPARLRLPLSGLMSRADRLSAACCTGNPVAGLATFAASLGRQFRIPRKAALLRRDALSAFAAGLRGALRVVLEIAAAGLAALAGDLTLPLLIHRGKAAV